MNTSASPFVDFETLDVAHPVAFHVNGLGDRILALPAMRALARLYPQKLRVLGAPLDRERFYWDLPLADFVEVKTWSESGTRQFDPEEVSRATGNCDLFVSFNGWHSSSMDELLRALPTDRQLGHFSAFSRCVEQPVDRHCFDAQFDLVQQLNPQLELASFAAAPVPEPSAGSLIRVLRSTIPQGSKILAIHSETKAYKSWPTENYVRVLREFLAHHSEVSILLLDTENRAKFDQATSPERIHPFAPLPFSIALGLLGVADLFLGVDSCMLHAADLYRIPGVGLFGPANMARWGFRFSTHRHVGGHGPMEAIRPSEVLDALEEIYLLSHSVESSAGAGRRAVG